MEVPGRYWRARSGTGGHVFPAVQCFWVRHSCPRVPARVQPGVPVSYPRCVCCLRNRRQTLEPWHSNSRPLCSTGHVYGGGGEMSSLGGRPGAGEEQSERG